MRELEAALNPFLELALTAVMQLIVAAFVYGQLTQRLKDQGGWLKKHDEKIAQHGDRLVNHEGRISHIEGARESRAAGSRWDKNETTRASGNS